MLTDASVAALFGFAGVSFGATWGLFRSKKAIITAQALCSACFITHYALIGAVTGAAMSSLSLTQSLLVGTGWRGRLMTALFWLTIPVMALFTALTWNGVPSLASGLGLTLAACGRWQTNLLRLRLFFLASTLCWIVHDVMVGSAFGCTANIVTLSTNLWGIVRERRRSMAPAAPVGALA